MKKEISGKTGGVIAAVAAVVILAVGFVYVMRAGGAASEDVDLAKKQAAVEHSQFASKVPGTPPDPGAGEMAARQRSGSR